MQMVFFMVILSLYSCRTPKLSPATDVDRPSAHFTSSAARNTIRPNSVAINLQPSDNQEIDFYKIEICSRLSLKCSQWETVRENEVLLLTEKGNYELKVSQCNKKQECTVSDVISNVEVQQASLKKQQIKDDIDKLQASIHTEFLNSRKILQDLKIQFLESPNKETKDAISYLLSLNESALVYLLSNLFELPLDNPEALQNLAKDDRKLPLGNAQRDDVPQTNHDMGNAMLITAYTMAGVAATIGFVAFLKRDGDIFKYIKPLPPARQMSESMRSPKTNRVGDVGSNILIFNGTPCQLPDGYHVASLDEYSVLENGHTRPLGKGSQGTVFVVQKN